VQRNDICGLDENNFGVFFGEGGAKVEGPKDCFRKGVKDSCLVDGYNVFLLL